MAPADRLPPHIAALPEPEQGPALVHAIHARLAARKAMEYTMRVGGRGYGKTAAARQAWQRMREQDMLEHMLGMDIAFDGATITATRRLNTATGITRWLLDIEDQGPAVTQDTLALVRDIVDKAFVTPKPDNNPAVVVRWACTRPTEIPRPYRPGTNGWLTDHYYAGTLRPAIDTIKFTGI